MSDDQNTPRTSNEVYVASREKANNGYGQNGSDAPSSVLPGRPVPQLGNPDVAPPTTATPTVIADDWQTRKVDATPLPLAHGARDRTLNPVRVDSKLNRVPSGPARGGIYQR